MDITRRSAVACGIAIAASLLAAPKAWAEATPTDGAATGETPSATEEPADGAQAQTLSDRHVLVLGDELSAPSWEGYAETNWVTQMCDAGFLDPDKVTNDSLQGHGYSRVVVSGEDVRMPLYDRIRRHGDNYDLVVFHIGANDFASSAPLPKFKQDVDGSFDYAKSRFSKARIAVVAPLRRDDMGKRNKAGATLEDYSAYIRDAAARRGWSVLDMTDDGRFDPVSPSFSSEGTHMSDGKHPSAAATRDVLLPIMEPWLLSVADGEGAVSPVPHPANECTDVLGVGDYRVLKANSRLSPTMFVDVSGSSKAEGGNIQIWDNNEAQAQRFRFAFKKTGGEMGYYTITNVRSGRAITAMGSKDGANVAQTRYAGRATQKWVLARRYGKWFSLINLGTGMPLDVAGAGRRHGTNIQVGEASASESQQFCFVRCDTIRDGVYVIQSVANHYKAVDVSGNSPKNGANVQIWGIIKNGPAQRFRFEYDKRNGYYLVTNATTNKALDVQRGLARPGTNIRMWNRNGSYAQRWAVAKKGGGYTLIAACNARALGTRGNKCINHTNIQCERQSNARTQQWKLVRK